MNDLISRQDVIDALNKKWVEEDFKDEFGYGFDACLNWMDALIRKLPSAQKWIPCSERLPEESDVLNNGCWARLKDAFSELESNEKSYFEGGRKIQIVIDIPEHIYEAAKEMQVICGGGRLSGKTYLQILINSVQKGTPLPKGHGRLIDADDIDNHIIGHVDTRSCPTIIEADRGKEDE